MVNPISLKLMEKTMSTTTTTTDLIKRVTFDRATITKHPEFKAGDTLNVHVKIKEGSKERIQIFKGVVIKVQNGGMGKSFTIRKVSSGIGVERTFPLASPAVTKIELVSIGKVRRSRLFYLRSLKGRAARLESTMVTAAKKIKAPKADKKAKAEAPKAKEAAPKES